MKEIQTLAAGQLCKRWIKSLITGSDDYDCGAIDIKDEEMIPVTEALI